MSIGAQRKNEEYRTALYLRLSKDDDVKSESASITTQRRILQDYADVNGFRIADEYADDGYSGTNYDRPGFQRLVRDIENGRINCILTKDLSRLGRNGARTSDLLDEYFPLHGIRFISVTDGYDSLHVTNGIAMSTSFLVTLHEMYARDISCKIRSSFQAKMENGEYIASFAPYGYQKDPDNKNRLIIDYRTADIVRKIFYMAADGSSPHAIAQELNSGKVATPAVYRCTVRPYLNVDDYSQRKEWTSSMICKMLKNTVYLGHTSQGKTSKVSFKSRKTVSQKPEEWIVVPNTHEAIVSEEVFRIVRGRSAARRKPRTGTFTNIFSGIARCADCGRSMTTAPSAKKGTACNLCCGGYKTYGARECSNHFTDYGLLYETVLQGLKEQLALTEEEKQSLIRELESDGACERLHASDTACDPAKAQKRIREIGLVLRQLYEDKRNGAISETVYSATVSEYEAELSTLNGMLLFYGDSSSDIPADEAKQKLLDLLNDTVECRELTKSLLHRFIDHITVEQGTFRKAPDGKREKIQKINVYYRFREWSGGE